MTNLPGESTAKREAEIFYGSKTCIVSGLSDPMDGGQGHAGCQRGLSEPQVLSIDRPQAQKIWTIVSNLFLRENIKSG